MSWGFGAKETGKKLELEKVEPKGLEGENSREESGKRFIPEREHRLQEKGRVNL